jgi:hypothetical protein
MSSVTIDTLLFAWLGKLIVLFQTWSLRNGESNDVRLILPCIHEATVAATIAATVVATGCSNDCGNRAIDSQSNNVSAYGTTFYKNREFKINVKCR